MKNFATANILDLLEIFGEDKVKTILSDFSCEKNKEIELFVKNNAVDFAQRKISITYLVFDENMQLAAIFTLAHKAIEFDNDGVSKTVRKKIQRYAQLNENTNTYDISAFLVAQFGKNSSYDGEPITGDYLMRIAEDSLRTAQKIVGGGFVYLECEDKEPLLHFYKKEENGYHFFNDRYSLADKTKYIQLFKFI